MKARDIMTPDPFAVTVSDPVWRAAEMMRYEDIGGVPVVSDRAERRLVGLITDRDITVRCVARRHGATCNVVSHMTPLPLRTVHPDDDIREIVRHMEAADVRRVPVVDENGVLIGIVAERDLVMKLAPSDAVTVHRRIKEASRRPVAPIDAAVHP